MLFHSLDFAIFLPIVFFLYWFVAKKNLKLQNALIVTASYVFYGWWDWRFLSLIIFSTLVDYSIGRRLKNEEKQSTRKILMWTSIIVNLGFLGFFKYYNFFLDNFIAAFSFFGQEIQPNTLNIILPVGISFYTFQTLSYTIDVYRNKLEPTEDFIAFSAFVCFFPQLVAGPIERASNLLPQFYKKRIFTYEKSADGMRQILWGLFKKVVIADNCAEYANLIFNNYGDYNGPTLILGVIFFAFQVYGDFSGYSDIAIGTSKLFGFNLMQNFATPYFSRNIMEFWKRWHISLTSWLTDYVFTPLAINYRHWGTMGIVSSIFFTFLISGLWHGANWTFIVWGALHGLYFLITILFTRGKTPKGIVGQNSVLPSLKEIGQIVLTFLLVCFSYIFFRVDSLSHGFAFISRVCKSDWNFPDFEGRLLALQIIILIVFLLFVEYAQRNYDFTLDLSRFRSKSVRLVVYISLVLLIIIYWPSKEQVFVYFQF
jgi:alginate O-acetyltransferase complex protein AlgI